MATADLMDSLVSEFQALQPYLPGSGDLALKKIRQSAMQSALNTKAPTYKQNTWKYARLEALLNAALSLQKRRTTLHEPEQISSQLITGLSENSFVFVNGFYMPALSEHPDKSEITIKHFRTMSEKQDDLLTELVEASSHSKGFFHQLNAALVNDGALIIIPTHYQSEQPIIITHVLVDYGDHHYWVSPQTHIFVEKNAKATIVENTIILTTNQACMNSQTLITLHPHSQLHYLRLDKGSSQSHTFSHVRVTQHDSSNLTINACTHGGSYQRMEIENNMFEKNAHYQLQGLMLPAQAMHHDWVTKLNHLTSYCESIQNVKSIIGNEGHGSYLGSITVNQQSIKTNALMENHHLLLTENGKADSSPQFEIFCDDVKCNHGSTTGQLDEELMFYLQSRGMNHALATEILLASYITPFVQSINNKDLSAYIENHLHKEIQHIAMDVPHDI